MIVDGQGRVAALWASFSLQVPHGGRLQNVQAFQGIPAEFVTEVVGPLARGDRPKFKTIGAEYEFIGLGQVRACSQAGTPVLCRMVVLSPTLLSKAILFLPWQPQVRGMGLDDASVAALEQSCTSWPPRLLAVKRRWGGTPAAAALQVAKS